MKKRHSNVAIIVLILVSTCFTGCFPKEKRSDINAKLESKNGNLKEIPTELSTMLCDNVNVNAKINVPTGIKEVSDYNATIHLFEAKKVADILLKNKKYNIVENQHEGFNGKFIESEESDELQIDAGYIYYRGKQYNEKNYTSAIFGAKPRADIKYLKKIYTKQNIEGIDKNNVKNNVNIILDNLGITDITEPEIIALDYEKLKKIDTDGDTRVSPFTKNDECYLFCYEVEKDKISITDRGYFKNADDAIPMIGTRIYVLANEREIIFLQCENIYDFNKKENSKIKGINFEYVLNQIKNKYQNLILDEPIEISDIELRYVPCIRDSKRIKYEFKPYWIIRGKEKLINQSEKGMNVFENEIELYISYETGKILETSGTE